MEKSGLWRVLHGTWACPPFTSHKMMCDSLRYEAVRYIIDLDMLTVKLGLARFLSKLGECSINSLFARQICTIARYER